MGRPDGRGRNGKGRRRGGKTLEGERKERKDEEGEDEQKVAGKTTDKKVDGDYEVTTSLRRSRRGLDGELPEEALLRAELGVKGPKSVA